ncbi:nitroreductase family protein [Streptomyces decoyicus]|uniref:nitroreductase family protein n=1 Tax=Streptomyces decoyicus TaxID=249567 RepID=UPI002E198462
MPKRLIPASVPLGPPIRFAARKREWSPLRTVLDLRQSVRIFDPDPVDASLVADVVARGIQEDFRSWPTEQEQCPLQTTVVAFRLDGLGPGMYSLDTLAGTGDHSQEHAYVQVAPLPEPDVLHDLTLQREFCDSAAIISIAADLDRASELHGAHGYRMLMGRAAAAAYTMWLDAVAVGLVGSVFAGFIPAMVRQPLRSDGASRHQIFALALGGAPVQPPHIPPGSTGHR